MTLFDGTTAVGSGTVGADGTWSVTSGKLAAGTHSLTAVQTDVAGNVASASSALTLTIDTATPSAPSAPVLSAASDTGVQGDDITSITVPVLTGTGTAGDKITLLDGTTVVGTAIVGANGTWSVTSSTLAATAHTLTATATDVAGNVSGSSAALSLTIDTTAPTAPSAPVLAPGSDSGVQGDDITNVTTPTLNGSGPGRRHRHPLRRHDDDRLRRGWREQYLVDHQQRAHRRRAPPERDLHRRQRHRLRPPSTALTLTIDTTAPAAPSAPALAAASDSGILGDGLTNVTTPTLTGTGTAGDTVTLSDGGTIVGSGVVGAGGTWSITTTTLAPGPQSLTATQGDVAGNVSAASTALGLDIDTAAPDAPSAPSLLPTSDSGTLGDNLTKITTPTLTGTGITGDTVTLLDGSTTVGSGAVGAGGTWSITTSTLANGTHGITAVQTDAAGNVSMASAALGLAIDTTAPAAPGTPALAASSDSGIQGDDVTNLATPLITGTGAAGDTITLLDNMAGGGATGVGTATVASDGTWSVTSLTLSAGANSLTATETDSAGNVSTASTALNLTIDTTAPAAPSAPVLAAGSDSGTPGDDITNVTAPTFTGTGTAGDTVTLYDGAPFNGGTVVGTATVASDDSWTITSSTLSASTHGLTATQTDYAGNVSVASTALSLTIGTAAPSAPSSPLLTAASDSGVKGDDITNVTTPVITGTGTTGDTVTLRDGSAVLATAVVGADGGWSITTGSLAAGMHSLTATETDSAGNVSAASGPLSLAIETAAPAAPASPMLGAASDSGVQGDNITNVTSPTITGTGIGGDTITLYDGTPGTGTVIGAATVGGDGTWSVNSSALAAGAHDLTATQADVAGNVSTAYATLDLGIETAAPAAPLKLALAAGSDSGTPGDDITNITTPVINGTGAAGDTVTLLDGTTIVGSGLVGTDGSWSITTSTLAAGTHTITALQTDVAGNVSAVSPGLGITIDTTPPSTPSAPVPAAASDTGVPGDDITAIATPTLTGTGDAGDSITLLDGTSVIGTATVAGDGTWSIASSALGNGMHTLSATQTDAAGNVSAASPALILTIDTVIPPAPPAPVLSAASDSGVQGDDITSDTTPVLAGTGITGDTITLYDGVLHGGGTIVGIATVAADGTWFLGSSMLAAGTHSLTATQTDVAGNVSAQSAALSLSIDTTPPSAPSTPVLAAASDTGVPGDGITSITTPVLTGTGSAGDTVTLLEGATVVGTATVAGDDTWSVNTSALVAGTHRLDATQTDIAGNVSAASAPLALTIDTAAPSAPSHLVLAAASDSGARGDDITNVATPTITGLGVAGDTVSLLDGAARVGTAIVAGNGTWSVTSGTLAAGTHSLTAIQSDVAGNVSAASTALDVTIDTAAPAAPVALALAAASDSGTQGDDITNATTPTITGTGTAGDTVTLRNGGTAVGTAMVAGDGSWSVTTSTLAAGSHSLTATQTDVAGNVSAASASLALTIDTTTPATPSKPALAAASDSGAPGDGITNVTTPTITGTGAAGDTVTVLDGSTIVGTAMVGATGTWSFTSSTLAAGAHSLSATQTDSAGNQSAASAPLQLTIDTASPAAPTGLVLAGMDVEGTAASGDTVTVQEDGGTVGTTQANGNGSFSLALDATEATGLHTVTATVTDAAGNSSAAASLVIGAFHWASPVNGVFTQSGEWLVNGAQTASVPSAATDLAYFDTGSPNAYTVTGNGTAGEIRVDGDHVTYSGTLSLAGLQDGAAGGDTSLVVDRGGSLALGAGTSVLGGAALAVGGASAGTLTLSGTLSDASATIGNGGTMDAGSGATWSTSGDLTLGAGGSLTLDDTATLTGTVLLDGGVLTAQPDANGGDDVVLSDALQGVSGTTSYIGSIGGATLTLSGSRTLGAGELIYRGGTIILEGALPTDAAPAVVDGATLELGGPAQTFTASITTLAGTTNTLVLNADAANVTSNGNDTIEIGSGDLAATVTGAAAIVGGSGDATIYATGSTVTVSGGTGDIVISGTANAVIASSSSKNVTYSGTGQVSFTGNAGAGVTTLDVTTGGTITTAVGGDTVVNLGTGAAQVNAMGSDTVDAASGAATIYSRGASLLVHGGSGSLAVNGGSGPLTFLGGSGSTTVSGGAAAAVIVGGAAGGVLTGGSAGDSVLVSNGSAGAATTIQGEGGGNQIFGSASGQDVLDLGAGRSSVLGGGGATTIQGGATGSVIFTGSGPTVVVAGAGGQDTIVGGAGNLAVEANHGEAVFGGSGALDVAGSMTGADSIIGGSGALTVAGRGGNMLVVGGSGSSNIRTGNGASLIFAGAGNMTLNGGSGSMQVIVGAGHATVAEGSGPTSYDVVSGAAGGIEIVSGFKVGTDRIDLFGYQSSQTTILSNGTTSIVQLSDGTKIELLGVPHPNASVVG
nr:Ig-like domain-containing protein [uncultured Lichenicoccus sp.]